MKKITISILALTVMCTAAFAGQAERTSHLVRTYISPARIMAVEGEVKNPEFLMPEEGSTDNDTRVTGQSMLTLKGCMMMKSSSQKTASVLLDFGRELHGGIRITTGGYEGGKPTKVRIRMGESVSEASCEINGINGATNDHAIRDFEAALPWMGTFEYGNSGFRFVRIDLLECDKEVAIREINAVKVDSDYPQIGSFRCSDERLSTIWETGRHTVKLNTQDYIWDGIKRDRLVWIGDIFPEVMTICNVYGNIEAVPRSLDYAKADYKLPGWINGFSSYSIWWLLSQYKWFRYTGDRAYLESQKDYFIGLVKQIAGCVGDDNREHLTGTRFLDWPSNADTKAIDTGLHALTLIALEYSEEIAGIFGEEATAKIAREAYAKLAKGSEDVKNAFFAEGVPADRYGRKQAVALMYLAGMISDQEASDNLLFNKSHGFSTFYGFYMLEALAKAGKYEEAMDIISEYWGAMIDLGATSFWEDFDIDWTKNASRIDELPVPGKIDVHRTYGGYCYKGLRHSLCHGWASGPTSWITRHVLGLEPASAGQDKVSVNPHLGKLEWAEGSYPTPYGELFIRVEKNSDGKTVAKVKSPGKIRLVAGKDVIVKKIK